MQTRRRLLRALGIGLAVAVLAVTAASAAGFLYLQRLSNNISVVDISALPKPTPMVAPSLPSTESEPVEEKAQPLIILLMGSDSRDGENSEYGDPNVYSTARSDTTILLHVSGDRSHATAVSIPRDTWTMLPECSTPDGGTEGGYEGKFNAAFQYGGPACTVRLVQDMTGIAIDHFIVVDFDGFKTVVDSFGGVQMCIPFAVSDEDSRLSLDAGFATLTGEEALAFVRARKQLSDGSDISRIARQQDFLAAFAQQAVDARILLDPLRLNRVLTSVTESLTTDKDLGSVASLAGLALELRDLNPKRVHFLTVPWVPRGDGENVVVDESTAAPLWEKLQRDEWTKSRNSGSGGGGNTQEPGAAC